MVEQQQQQEKTKQQSRPFNNSINNCHRKFCFANISAKIQIDCEMQTGSGLFISMVRVNSVTHQFMRRFFVVVVSRDAWRFHELRQPRGNDPRETSEIDKDRSYARQLKRLVCPSGFLQTENV